MTRNEASDQDTYTEELDQDLDNNDEQYIKPSKIQQLVELFSLFPIIPGIVTASLSSPDDWYLAAGLASAFPAREHYRRDESASVIVELLGWLQVGLTIFWAIKGESEVADRFAPAIQWWINTSYKITDPALKVLDATYESGQWMADRPITLVLALALLSTIRLAIPKLNNKLETMTKQEMAQMVLNITVVSMIRWYEFFETVLETLKRNNERFIFGNKSSDDTQETN